MDEVANISVITDRFNNVYGYAVKVFGEES